MSNKQMEFLGKLGDGELSENLQCAVSALGEGKPILLLDDNDRENEGDLIIAAEKIDTKSMNYLIREGSGVVCLALPPERLEHLGLPLMIPKNTNFFQTAFTVSIEAKEGVSTGVSAQDRAHTILVAMEDDAKASDLARPGHVFPLAAQEGGVFSRMGHTEGSVDLMRIAKLKPGAVLCELMNQDGSMTTGNDRLRFAERSAMPVVTVEEVLFHRIKTENIIDQFETKNISSRFGDLIWHRFSFKDEVAIDIFQKPERSEDSATKKKLFLCEGGDILQRLMKQLLSQNDDDPLASGLKNLGENKTDLVVSVTGLSKKPAINETSEKRIHLAHVCRALDVIGVRNLAKENLDDLLFEIGQKFFAIKVN